MYKIMIVEDDNTIATILEEQLKKWGFDAFYVTDFANVADEYSKTTPELILLDISLPFFNGYYWCAEIRKVSKVPIIFISSNSADMDIVMAINMGADDFIIKPFKTDIVVAKIRALLRRTYSYQEEIHTIEHEGLILNLSDASLMYKGARIDLTKNEFRILQMLMENKGNTVSRDNIMKKLWDDECFIDDNTLTVNVTRLRKKLEGYGIKNFIFTKKGLGYYIYDKVSNIQ